MVVVVVVVVVVAVLVAAAVVAVVLIAVAVAVAAVAAVAAAAAVVVVTVFVFLFRMGVPPNQATQEGWPCFRMPLRVSKSELFWKSSPTMEPLASASAPQQVKNGGFRNLQTRMLPSTIMQADRMVWQDLVPSKFWEEAEFLQVTLRKTTSIRNSRNCGPALPDCSPGALCVVKLLHGFTNLDLVNGSHGQGTL